MLARLTLGWTIFPDFPAARLAAALDFVQPAAQAALSAVVLAAVAPRAVPPQHSTKRSSCRPLPDERSNS